MKYLKWIAVFIFFTALASCGYQFEGGGYINNDLLRVAVKPFENKSAETGAGVTFTNALIQEILEKTDSQVVGESEAQAVFHGRIESITFSTISRSSTETVVERRVRSVVDVSLVSSSGDVLLSLKNFAATEDYTVDADKIADEGNKREAVQKIADRSAEKLISRTLVDF